MKKNIAIVAGGDSGEYEISMKSASVVLKHLDKSLYKGYLIEVGKSGWLYKTVSGEQIAVDRNDFSLQVDGNKVTFDCVFNAIHGTPGEDGLLLGYFEMLGIVVTSSGQTTLAITFNKYYCNRLVSTLGVTVAHSVMICRGSPIPGDIPAYPCFVKPNNGGSSVGISKVHDEEALEPAVMRAFEEDDQVLIEAFIPGREITCGVIVLDGRPAALPITEIISGNEFFDYEAKYTEGGAREITPAPIPGNIAEECSDTSVMLYNKLNCKGMVRFDYIFNDEGLYFLEVNTVPGLTEASIVPRQAELAGISLKELFSGAIEAALNT